MYLVPGNYQAPDRGDLCRTHNLGSNLGKLRQGGGLPRAAAMDWNGHCVGLCGSLRDGIHERCHPSVEVRRVPAKYRRAVGVASQWLASTKPSSWRFCGVLPLPSTVVGVGGLPGTRC